MHNGVMIVFLKKDEENFALFKEHSETSHGFFSASSAMSPVLGKEPTVVNQRYSDVNWSYTESSDPRFACSKEHLESELAIILAQMSEDDITRMKSMPVGERVVTQVVKGTRVTPSSGLKLELIDPRFALFTGDLVGELAIPYGFM